MLAGYGRFVNVLEKLKLKFSDIAKKFKTDIGLYKGGHSVFTWQDGVIKSRIYEIENRVHELESLMESDPDNASKYKDEIDNCWKQKTTTEQDAHFNCFDWAKTPKCEECCDNKGDCNEDVCSCIAYTLDFSVKYHGFWHNFTGETIAYTKIFNPSITECDGHFLAKARQGNASISGAAKVRLPLVKRSSGSTGQSVRSG